MSGPTEFEARAFLTEHLGRDVGPVEEVGAGAWSTCFGFTDEGHELVVRFGIYVDDFERDQHASTYDSPSLPVPRLIEIGKAFDGWFAISTRAHGAFLESIDGWEPILPSLFAALDAMRAIEIAGEQSWPDFLLSTLVDTPERRTHGWRQKLADSPVGDGPFVAGLALLGEIAIDTDPHLIHRDLINRNVLVNGARITAVLDWGCAGPGDFLYDIAWLEFWAPWHPALEAVDIRARAREHYATIGLGIPDFDRRMRACLLHIGLDHQAWMVHIDDLDGLAKVVERTDLYLE